MQSLNLGRTPIREALQRLARDDLVIIQPRRGMYVSEVSVTDLKQIFEARLPLETWSARLAAERITERDLERLKNSIGLAEDAAGDDFVPRLMESDRLVHAIISEATGNKFLVDGVRWLYDLTARIWRLTTNPAAGSESIQRQHWDLLEALRRRDADAAEELMRQHILDFWSQVRSHL
jgi:DNA-binding GntR family transcriptional regulator